jgi:arylsulfatase A-like enzyme
VDTLRADALGAFRDGRPVPVPLERAATPKLDALASESAVFLEAATPIPKTPQAIASLMTALYPGAHGVRDLFSRLDRSRLTLAEVLRERGYRTRAVVTNMLVGRGSGLSQGFDRYRDKDGLRPQVKRLAVVDLLARLAPAAATWCLNRFEALRMGREDAAETTDRALEALAEVGGAPYFLWVHYLDPHWIYWAPEPHRSAADARPGEPFRLYDDVRSGRVKIGEMIHRNAMSREEVERVRSLYAGEVSYIDAEVGRLLDAALAGAGARSTLVVFTSDHGESLGEHGYFFSHGDQVHEPSLRVPLIVRPPAGGAGKVVREPVGLVDVMPTALEILGAPIPARIQGISLTSLAGADGGAGGGPAAAAARVLFGESDLSYLAENPLLTIPGEAGKMRSIRSGSLKLVRIPRDVEAARRVDPDLGASNAGRRNALGFEEATRLGPSGPDVVALYDLAADPAETRDLAPEEPARSAALLEALDAWVRASAGPPGAEREGSRELLEGLRSLGYVDPGGGAP